jgi:PAP2 superfamily
VDAQSNTPLDFTSLMDNSLTNSPLPVNAQHSIGSDALTGICNPAPTQPNAVLFWNQVALEAIAADKTAPPKAECNLALLSTTVFDVVNDITRVYQPYSIDKIAPAHTSAAAAVDQAAYDVLVNCYPAQKAAFDTALLTSLGQVADGKSKTNGINFGNAIAEAMIGTRKNDGSATANTPFVPNNPDLNTPGQWQPTAPKYAAPVLPGWGKVTPFIVPSVADYLPPAPPALTSQQYTTDFNQVASLGSATSTTRTADQTQIAQFWSDGAGTYTPPGHWNQIAQTIATKEHLSLLDSAKLFGVLNVAMTDAGISCWNTKYTYDFWRPITAIQKADIDGNPNTTADPNWKPLLATPPFPEYISGHSSFSGSAAAVLTGFFGENYAFSSTSLSLPGVTRNFTSFNQAAQEAGMSRIYGGIHFMFSNTTALEMGKSIGNYALTHFGLLPHQTHKDATQHHESKHHSKHFAPAQPVGVLVTSNLPHSPTAHHSTPARHRYESPKPNRQFRHEQPIQSNGVCRDRILPLW